MEKERRIRILSIIALVIAVLGLTIAFASLSTTLKINGGAKVDAATWDVKFEELSSASTTGSASEIESPTISEDGKKIENMKVHLTKPKDSVTYTVYVANNGSINAEVTSIKTPTLTEKQKKYLEFSATYEDGNPIENSNIINAGEKEKVIIKIRFKEELEKEDLPKEGEEIELSFEIEYVQTDNKKVSTSKSNTPTETDDYIKEGLVLYLDGINNTGKGHDNTTNVWKDLSGNSNDATLQNYDSPTWDSKSLLFNGVNQYAQILTPSNNIPIGESPYTIEVVFKSNNLNVSNGLFNIGVFYVQTKGNAFRTSGKGLDNYYWSNDLIVQCNLQEKRIYNGLTLNSGNKRKIYLNSELQKEDVATVNTELGNVTVGLTYPPLKEYLNGNIYAVRVYNRGLTESEIKHNFEIDKLRFGITSDNNN